MSTHEAVSRATILKAFIGIAAATLILRIFYAGHLYQDDGLWFSAAEEMLRGNALYREIFFDKPPGLPLVYAALFTIFGAHIITIRLFTIVYSLVVSFALYVIGSRMYSKRIGLVAAGMFAVFSTTYISGDMQSLNTEFLMAPFYAVSAYLLILSGTSINRPSNPHGIAGRHALLGGAAAGIAFQINPKGAFDLIFFAALLFCGGLWRAGVIETNMKRTKSLAIPLRLFALAVFGFALASIPFVVYIAATHSLAQYKFYVWDWGFRYARYYPASRAVEIFLRYSTDYFLINNTLLIAFVAVVAVTIRQARRYVKGSHLRHRVESDPSHRSELDIDESFTFDWALLIWFAVSFLGVATGGRFFAHYYFQTLPCLCLIGARGLAVIRSSLRAQSKSVRLAVCWALIGGLTYTLARSHAETAMLAVDWLRGNKSEINREARVVAATVRGLPDPAGAADRLGVEGLREGGPTSGADRDSSDYLFVWGNLPEVYYWSGLLPASRYLSTQPLTGLPADVQYGNVDYRFILDAGVTASGRRQLISDLAQTRPKYIVDELGFRDARLSIRAYPDLSELMNSYERFDSASGLPIYVRRP